MAPILHCMILILSFSLFRSTDGKIVGAFVLPHGGIALDPNYFTNGSNASTLQEAWELHNACVQVGEQVRQMAPDLIVLSTPHGIADLNNFQFYLNGIGRGPADTDNCVPSVLLQYFRTTSSGYFIRTNQKYKVRWNQECIWFISTCATIR